MHASKLERNGQGTITSVETLYWTVDEEGHRCAGVAIALSSIRLHGSGPASSEDPGGRQQTDRGHQLPRGGTMAAERRQGRRPAHRPYALRALALNLQALVGIFHVRTMFPDSFALYGKGLFFLPGAASTETELRAAATLVKELSLVARLYSSRIVVHAAATG